MIGNHQKKLGQGYMANIAFNQIPIGQLEFDIFGWLSGPCKWVLVSPSFIAYKPTIFGFRDNKDIKTKNYVTFSVSC